MRSTPSPATMRRTVNISLRPWPLRAMTVPVKTWMRSLSPSTILQWTSTISPMRKKGTFFFRHLLSTASNNSVFTGLLLRCCEHRIQALTASKESNIALCRLQIKGNYRICQIFYTPRPSICFMNRTSRQVRAGPAARIWCVRGLVGGAIF